VRSRIRLKEFVLRVAEFFRVWAEAVVVEQGAVRLELQKFRVGILVRDGLEV